MAWRTQKTETGTDIIIDGFEKGIAPNPYAGIADIRNANLISVPSEASVNFATTATQLTPVSAAAYTVTNAGDTFTVSGDAPRVGTALTFTITTGSGNLVAGTVYWVNSTLGSTFTITAILPTAATGDTSAGATFNISSDGTGTYSTVNVGMIKYYAQSTSLPYFIDANGRAWICDSNYYPVFLGNITLTNGNGNGIAIWHGYLFVFRNALIDYTSLSGTASWTYGWKTMNNAAGTNNPHETLIGQDDELYYTDSYFIGSLIQVAVGTAFDPTTASTYTWSVQALVIPKNDTAQCLAYLGDNLLIGGIQQFIYSWNRVLTNQYNLIIVSENNIHRMVTANTNVFIFAGSRGRIYVTNGSQADIYAKVPDHLADTVEPNMAWGGAMFNRNQLYFGLTAFNPQTSAVISQYGGVWAIDLSSGYQGNWQGTNPSSTLRHVNILSYGTYAGYLSALTPIKINATVAGVTYDVWGFACGWYDGVSLYGQDVSISITATATPYTNFQTYIISDAIPIGTLLNKQTTGKVEWKLAIPLASSNEAVRLSYRVDKVTGDSSTWTVFGTTTGATAGTISDAYDPAWEKAQWLQIKAELDAASSSPSYVRLKELRIHLHE